jgi:hypothetical protein
MRQGKGPDGEGHDERRRDRQAVAGDEGEKSDEFLFHCALAQDN